MRRFRRIALAGLAALVVGACVQTTRYTMHQASPESAREAVRAAQDVQVARGVVHVCEGERIYALTDARLVDGSLCGRFYQYGEEPSDRCFAVADLTAIGVPRRSTAIGYFVVPIFPESCQVEQ